MLVLVLLCYPGLSLNSNSFTISLFHFHVGYWEFSFIMLTLLAYWVKRSLVHSNCHSLIHQPVSFQRKKHYSFILYRKYFWKSQQLDFRHREQDVDQSISPKLSPFTVLQLLSPLLEKLISFPDSGYVYSRVERAENGEEKDVISKIFHKLFTLPVLWGLWVFLPAMNLGDPGLGTILTATDILVCRLSTPITKHFNASISETICCQELLKMKVCFTFSY